MRVFVKSNCIKACKDALLGRSRHHLNHSEHSLALEMIIDEEGVKSLPAKTLEVGE
jgi:hypothetical protein